MCHATSSGHSPAVGLFTPRPAPSAEVARIELKEDVDIEHYANVPAVGDERLEIAFIEVGHR